jgi:hypothetical protein
MVSSTYSGHSLRDKGQPTPGQAAWHRGCWSFFSSPDNLAQDWTLGWEPGNEASVAPAPRGTRRPSFARNLALRAKSPLFRSDLVQASAGGTLACFAWTAVLCSRLTPGVGAFSARTPWEAHLADLLRYLGLSGELSAATSSLSKIGFMVLLAGLISLFTLLPWLLTTKPERGRWFEKRGATLLVAAATVPWFGGSPRTGLGFWAALGLTLAALGLLVVAAGTLSQDRRAPQWLRAASWMLATLVVGTTGMHIHPLLSQLGLWPPLEITALLLLVVWMLGASRLAKSRATIVIMRRLSEQAATQAHK